MTPVGVDEEEVNRLIAQPFYGRKWAAVGTSITSLDTYPPILASLSGMECTNIAVSGASLSSSSSYGASGFVSQIAAIPLDTEVVTVEAGANDFRGDATLGSLGDKTLTTFYGALYKTITDIVNQDWTRTVIVLGMYPNTPADSFQSANYISANGNGNYYYQFEKAIGEVCAWLNVPYVPAEQIGGAFSALSLSDGIHLSSDGANRYANTIHAKLKLFKPVTATWTLQAATISDFSGTRLTPSSIDGSGIVQYTGAPANGNAGLNWAALWLATGSNNAVEFEIAEPAKGLYTLFGRASDSSGWCGAGDPGFDNGPFNYLFAFSALGALYIDALKPATNNPGSYATKYRIARIGTLVFCQGFYSGTWKTVYNIDLAQQNAALTSTIYAVSGLGVIVNGSSYTKVKNVRVGTMELN